jgi:hypothetical protein
VNTIPIGTRVRIDQPLQILDGRTGIVIGHDTRGGWPACDIALDDVPDSDPGAATSVLIPERHLTVLDGDET